jgi:hypothetical protein
MTLGLGEGGEQMYRQARLSVQTRDWSERWFGLSTDSKAALVALRDQEPGRKRGAEMDLSTQGSRPERD